MSCSPRRKTKQKKKKNTVSVYVKPTSASHTKTTTVNYSVKKDMEKNQTMLRTYDRFGPLADYEMSELLYWNMREVVHRRRELMKGKQVVECDIRTNPFTKKKVTTYKLHGEC